MELWTIASALWLSTWAMCYGRTAFIIAHMVSIREGGELIVSYKFTHMVVYALLLFPMTPFIWQLAVFEDSRKRWCVSYVNAICKGTE